MPDYGFKIMLDGTTDITTLVKSFTIECDMENYCRELSLELQDEDLFDTLDFSQIAEATRLEVFTRIVEDDEYDSSIWYSQGKFFIEKPTYQVGLHETTTGIWGRQETAVLGEPFAQKVTKLWTSDTTFYAICEEILESVGLTWDYTNCDIQDFAVYADTFEADDQYPIEVLRSLIELAVGSDGYLTTDRLGNIMIRRLDRNPTSSEADYNTTDASVQSINEEPEWPEFANRIKIIPNETLSQDSVEITTDGECMGTSGPTTMLIYGQVKNGEGEPINDTVVTWSFDPPNPEDVWLVYPGASGQYTKTAQQNTSRILISNEVQRATGYNSVELEFEPDAIVGIWAYADKARVWNYAPAGTTTIDGKNVYTTYPFRYCDQKILVSYYASGMVCNTMFVGAKTYEVADPDYVFGYVNLIGAVSGRQSEKIIYINNSCQCKSTLTVKAEPSSIDIGDSANIDAYVENSGFPVSATVYMKEMTAFGTLSWSNKETSTLDVAGEITEAINTISGVTQCTVSSAITTVTSVYVCDDDGVISGSNLYSSFKGRTIDLNTYVATGTNLSVHYSRAGSVRNYFTGVSAGNAKIEVSVDVGTEEGLSQSAQVTVEAAPTVDTTTDTGWMGGADELTTTTTTTSETVSVVVNGPGSYRKTTIYDEYIPTTFYATLSNGGILANQQASVSVSGGWTQVEPYGNGWRVKVGATSCNNKVITVSILGTWNNQVLSGSKSCLILPKY